MAKSTKSDVRPATPAHLAARIESLQKRLKKLDAGALLVTNPRDVRYLTGFVGDDSWAVIPVKGLKVYILSDFRFEEQIQLEAPHARVVMRRAGLTDELEKLEKKREYGSIAVQAGHVTLAQFKALRKKLGKKRLIAAEDGLLAQRAIKDKAEVDAIRRSLGVQQRAFTELLGTLKAGRTEVDIAAELEHRMRSLGADGPSFPTIIAADANASLPHAIPGQRKLVAGGSLLVDWGARTGGYCSDLTRVVALGKMAPKIREIYKIVLDAQLAGIAAIKPGKPFKEVDKAARDIIAKAGFGDRFGHSLGHGIGLDIHEEPRLASRSEGVLQPGYVVTVEPGIYLPGVGGVRIEDDVLVTEKGGEVLSDLPKSLESAII